MKRWKKIGLVLLILFVTSQLPFCYRRLQLGVVNEKINQLNANRFEVRNEGFRHFKGVIHVHTSLGGHSVGNFNELITAASANELDFVLLTEHPSPLYDTARQTLNGFHGKTLFVGGNEMSSQQGDRFLVLPGDPEASRDTAQDTNELLLNQKSANRLTLITYPEKYQAWETATGFDGIEVYSLHTNAKRFSKLLAFFDFFWSFPAYPELTMARNFERPNENLKKFDELAASGKQIVLFGAADAHSNIGLSLSDRANHDLLKIHIDPYQTIFRLVRLHVWLAENQALTQENLLSAIKNGHCYLAFDVFADASSFSFSAENDNEKQMMGDRIALENGVRLIANAPLRCRFVIFRNGEKVGEKNDSNEFVFETKEPGAYRVEAYLDELNLTNAPWIISNPIYVR